MYMYVAVCILYGAMVQVEYLCVHIFHILCMVAFISSIIEKAMNEGGDRLTCGLKRFEFRKHCAISFREIFFFLLYIRTRIYRV